MISFLFFSEKSCSLHLMVFILIEPKPKPSYTITQKCVLKLLKGALENKKSVSLQVRQGTLVPLSQLQL